MDSEYYNSIKELIEPFNEAVIYAKSFGNISIKKPKFNIKKLFMILQDDIDKILNNVENKEKEYPKILSVMEFIFSN